MANQNALVCDECGKTFKLGKNIPTDTDGEPLCVKCWEYYAGMRETPGCSCLDGAYDTGCPGCDSTKEKR